MLACEKPYLYNKTKPGRNFDYSRKSRLKSTPFPCGKCSACMARRKREWGNRLLLESECHKDKVFEVTLTYCDADLPKDGILNRDHAILFLKRLRINIDRKLDKPYLFKYFLRGEYGTENLRPHFHLIVLGTPLGPITLKGGRPCYSEKKGHYFISDHVHEFEELVQRSWPYGSTDVKPIEAGTCHYVAGYTFKKLKQKLPAHLENTEVQSQSGGIGINYARKVAKKLSRDEFWDGQPITYVMRGRTRIPVGRYIRNKINFFLKKKGGKVYRPEFIRLLEAKYCYYFKKFHDNNFYKNILDDCKRAAKFAMTPNFKSRRRYEKIQTQLVPL